MSRPFDSPGAWIALLLVQLPLRCFSAPPTPTSTPRSAATPGVRPPVDPGSPAAPSPARSPNATTTAPSRPSQGPAPAERTLQDLARELKLRRNAGGSLTVQVDSSPGAVVQPADPTSTGIEEGELPREPRPRLSIVSASYSSPQGDSVPVLVTLASSGPVDGCSVRVVATLTADDGSLLGSGEAVVERVLRGQTTSIEVPVPVPSGTRVEVRGPTYTLYSGYGLGPRVGTATARVASLGSCP